MLSKYPANMQLFSATRMIVAREIRGLKQCDLAAALGITKGAVSHYENGQEIPTTAMVARMQMVLRFPSEWFYASDLDLIDVAAPSFRSRRSMGAVLRDRSVRVGDIAISIITPEVRRRLKYPVVDIPDLSAHSPEEAARLLRLAWKLGQGPIANLVHLLESRGVHVYWMAKDDDKVDAWSLWRDGLPFVVLNTHKTDGERGRFDAAHELGHLVLHRHAPVIEGRELEDEANTFASAFLLPAESFKAECPKVPNLDSFLILKRRWGVSVAAMTRRAYDLDLLTRARYEAAFKELTRRNWRKGEPNSWPRETSKVHIFLAQSLAKKGISPEQFAEGLMLHHDDVSELIPQLRGDLEPDHTRRVQPSNSTIIAPPKRLPQLRLVPSSPSLKK